MAQARSELSEDAKEKPSEMTNAYADGRVTVIFTPAGIETRIETGTTILDAARAFGVDLDSTCGGRGLCGRCQVKPSFGEFAKWRIRSDAAAVGEWTGTEETYAGRRRIADGLRLGCQAKILGDLVVDVPAASQVHRPVVRKTIDLPGLTIDPLITAHYVQLRDPALGDESSEAELLAEALSSDWGIDEATVAPLVLPQLHTAIVAGRRCVTAVVHTDGMVIDIRPGFDEALYGVAIDVGSTTIAGYLVDLADGELLASGGAMNPQIRFGEDLMSRVSYVMMNPGGETELTAAVRSAIDDLIDQLIDLLMHSLTQKSATGAVIVDRATIRRQIVDVVFVGNPVMHHLLLGINPSALGSAPFTLTISAPVNTVARELGLELPVARAHIGPCIAGHVGADAAAAMLNESTHRSHEPQLMVDVGTNAEIVLGTAEGTFAASSPTGPAFEGAQISCGVRAAAGAVERIRINRDTLEVRFKVIGVNSWSDDPEFAKATAQLDIPGLCGSAIIEIVGEMFLAGICDRNGVVQGSTATRTWRLQPDGRAFKFVIRAASDQQIELAVTQNDIRQIQLASAALRAGIDLLMEHAGVSEVRDIRLAGAFGAHIDPVYALVLGLIPDCPVSGVRAVGNSSGAGAVRMLLSAAQRAEISHAVTAVEKIETATESRFQELFVAAMAFPHATAKSPHLEKVMKLPSSQGDLLSRRRRRSRRANTRGESNMVESTGTNKEAPT